MTITARSVPQSPSGGSASAPVWFNQLADHLANAVVERVLRTVAARIQHAPQQVSSRSPYVTVEEAAAFLRCKPQRIYDLLSAGVLRRYKDGGRVLLKRSDLELHVEAAARVRAGARRVSGHA